MFNYYQGAQKLLRVTTTACTNNCGPVLPIPQGLSPRENPQHLGIELGTLEVKGEWSDQYTTKAPKSTLSPWAPWCLIGCFGRRKGNICISIFTKNFKNLKQTY